MSLGKINWSEQAELVADGIRMASESVQYARATALDAPFTLDADPCSPSQDDITAGIAQDLLKLKLIPKQFLSKSGGHVPSKRDYVTIDGRDYAVEEVRKERRGGVYLVFSVFVKG